MNSRARFLAACNKRKLERPPIWVMRQAGRYLPEYRELKTKYTFLEMVKTPELAMEVTLQPLQRFALDAAIIFSDILVIPEALGQPYDFRDGGGIQMAYTISDRKQIQQLDTKSIPEKLSYVAEAIKLVRKELGDTKAVIGFAGAPWTLATYMIEGGSSKNFTKAKALFFSDRTMFSQLMDKLTTAVTEYLSLQVAAGVDVIQIFDSWAGALHEHTYWQASGKYIARIVEHFQEKLPVIVYAKGAHMWPEALMNINATVYGVDSHISLTAFYDSLRGKHAVQGNLDNALMGTNPEIVVDETSRILKEFGERSGHIFNLGHGILPDAKIECMEALIETVTQWGK